MPKKVMIANWACDRCGMLWRTKTQAEECTEVCRQRHGSTREPRFLYDCGHCKFNWCCGELCACSSGLPRAPKDRQSAVDKWQRIWRKQGSSEKLEKRIRADRLAWYHSRGEEAVQNH